MYQGKRAAFAANQRLLYFPGIAGAQKLAKVAGTALGNNVFDLLIHQVFIARHVAPRTKNTDGRWEIRAVLLCAAACFSVSFRCPWKTSTERATNVASDPMAKETGLNGRSNDPKGVDFAFLLSSEVGEYCPFVSP